MESLTVDRVLNGLISLTEKSIIAMFADSNFQGHLLSKYTNYIAMYGTLVGTVIFRSMLDAEHQRIFDNYIINH